MLLPEEANHLDLNEDLQLRQEQLYINRLNEHQLREYALKSAVRVAYLTKAKKVLLKLLRNGIPGDSGTH